MDERAAPKLRWYQYSIRRLLLLMVAVSLVCSWLAVRRQRQREEHIVKVVIDYPGGSASIVDGSVAKSFVFAAFSLPFKRFATVSSFGQAEIYVVAQGVDTEQFMKQVRAIPTDTLPDGAVVKEVVLLDRRAAIPDVSSDPKDTFSIYVDRERCAHYGVSMETIKKTIATNKVFSADGEGAASMKEGARLLEETVVDECDNNDHKRIRLGDVAHVKIVQEPSHVVWRYPPESSDSTKPSM